MLRSQVVDLIASVIETITKSRQSAGGLARDYAATLKDLSKKLAKGKIGKYEFIRQVDDLIKSAAEDIYQHAAGSTYALEDDDYTLIKQWTASQQPYVEGFAQDIDSSGYTPNIERRLKLWSSAFSSLGSVGYIQANPKLLGEWRKGPKEKHCHTCVSLDGTVQPLEWFLNNGYLPGQPGSPGLDCGGWECGCGIHDAKTGRRLLPLVRTW